MTTHAAYTMEIEPLIDLKGRVSRRFWAIQAISNPIEVTGYDCGPNQSYWWVPELGSSLLEGVHLFATESAAIEHQIQELDQLRKQIKKRINNLQFRLMEL